MRVLITGGAGCLGSNLIEHWLPKGHQIFVVDNFATGKRELVPPGIPGLTLMEGSIADIDLVNRAFERFSPSHVVHAAAAYKDPDDWREDVSSNVLGTINVVDASRRAGVERFINLQTALCYGRPATLPIPVEHACFPVSSYGISKTAAENYVVISDCRLYRCGSLASSVPGSRSAPFRPSIRVSRLANRCSARPQYAISST